MFEPPGVYEYERKFLLEAERARTFWPLATSRLRHQIAQPCYVRTTYFDTPDLQFHRSSHGPVRRRLRVREYSQPEQPGRTPSPGERCFIELKQSREGLRHKFRIAVHRDEVAERIAGLAGAPLMPCVATWYRRNALTDSGLGLRITLDDHILVCKPRPLGSAFAELETDDVIARGPSFVLELKFSAAPPAWMNEALGDLEEAVGFSKFMLGMAAVEGAREPMWNRHACTG